MPRAELNIAGQRFGKLVALAPASRNKHNQLRWSCICDCGNTTIAVKGELRSGHTKSCGCLQIEVFSTRHGLNGSPIQKVMEGMVQRCYNPKYTKYHNYGGRGITICDEWRKDLNAFALWAKSTGYRKGLQIDRINNDGNYCPENCRWVTNKENQRNKRTNHPITFRGETKTIIEWSEISGLPKQTIYERILRGWNEEETLTRPIPARYRKGGLLASSIT